MGMEMQVTGMDDISRMLETLQDKAGGVAARGLYDGAKVMVQTVNASAAKIRTSPFRYVKNGSMRNPSPEEQDILTSHGAGVAKFDKNGSEVSTSIGYSGSGYATAAWGKTKAVAEVANAINSGTSFMVKQPFVRQAASKGKGPAEAAIVDTIDKLVNEITK